jgi:hypothetical protein
MTVYFCESLQARFCSDDKINNRNKIKVQMSLSAFDDKTSPPNEEMLSEFLSDSKILWDLLLKHLGKTCKNTSTEWKYYSKSAGWVLVVSGEKRKIVYLIPLKESFKTNFVFGEKAVAEAKCADLPTSVLTLILESKPYMEGRSFMVDVKNITDVEIVEKLLKIKINI